MQEHTRFRTWIQHKPYIVPTYIAWDWVNDGLYVLYAHVQDMHKMMLVKNKREVYDAVSGAACLFGEQR